MSNTSEVYPIDLTAEQVAAARRQLWITPSVLHIDVAVIRIDSQTSELAGVLHIGRMKRFEEFQLRQERLTLGQDGWSIHEEPILTLRGKTRDDKTAFRLLHSILSRRGSDADRSGALHSLFSGIEKSRKVALVVKLLTKLPADGVELDDWANAIQTTGGAVLREVGAAAKMVQYRAELDGLIALVPTSKSSRYT